jgi:D-hydroxyproline dehydrogenase subunit beta
VANRGLAGLRLKAFARWTSTGGTSVGTVRAVGRFRKVCGGAYTNDPRRASGLPSGTPPCFNGSMERHYDVLVVGAGILGLAHALAASRHGLRVAVLERAAHAIGASIRNFGFITVTGQQAGLTWRRALRTRDVWTEVAPLAGIEVLQRGLLMCARRPEALRCIEEFAASPMGAGCRVIPGDALPHPLRDNLAGALESPHELRVESRSAIPLLTDWLRAERGVTLVPRVAVHDVTSGRLNSSAGSFEAPYIIVCPGADLVTLFPEAIARRRVTLCKLHMLRLAAPDWRLPAPVMSDLGLIRYLGYAGCPSLQDLRARLEAEQAEWLADGIHLIAVQSADGSLVVGDSHQYADAPDPFQPRGIDDRMLGELAAIVDLPRPEVTERWIGIYPAGPDVAFHETPMPGVRLVMVTSGTGASTGFAIAEEQIADLLDRPPPEHAREP